MDLENVRLFVKVAELASFTRASEQLSVPKSRVSLRIKALETEVGSRLLQRTTRAVRLTQDGEQFFARARLLVDEADDLSTMFQVTSTLRGRVRVDLPIAMARQYVLPRLPELLALHPQLELVISTTDRRVDIVREGFDCVLRVGTMKSSGLVAKRIGVLKMANYVSPGYLRKYGTPRSIADLDSHLLVHYSQALSGDEPTFEYEKNGRWLQHPMRSIVTVNNTDAYASACVAGLGIIQVPRMGKLRWLEQGSLVEVLPAHTCQPMPVSLVHAHARNVPKRVRAVLAFLTTALQPAFSEP